MVADQTTRTPRRCTVIYKNVDLHVCRRRRAPQSGFRAARTKQLTKLAERRGSSVTELLDRLAEQARRQDILNQYNTRMAEILADPTERAAWTEETSRSELAAAELTAPDASAVAR